MLHINNAFTQGVQHEVSINRMFMRSFLPTPSHRAASAAKGLGSAGPVRRRRKTGTLYVIVDRGAPRPVAIINNHGPIVNKYRL